MRILGTIDGKSSAETLVAHLLTRNISTHVEASENNSDRWEIWVRDEDRMDDARIELQKYLSNPTDPAYSDSFRQAQQIVRDQAKKRLEAQKNYRPVRGAAPYRSRLGSLTIALLILCSIVSLATDFSSASPRNKIGNTILGQLKFVDMEAYKDTEDPLANIRRGEVWRIVTPIFLHGSALHLIFNMIMLIQLGRILENREGTVRFGIYILVIAIFSNLLQGLMPEQYLGTPNFVGFSGVVYGLFGFLWAKSSFRPDLLPQIDPSTLIIMLVLLAAGFAGVLGPIANLCHLGGLLAGFTLGWLTRNLNRPSLNLPK
jgi:GlpG protein